jgi:hypothetical protein
MIPGKEVEIGGTTYTLPPINVKSARKHKEFLSNLATDGCGRLPRISAVEEMVDIVFESLIRNYPAANWAQIEAAMDCAKLVEVSAVVISSGLADWGDVSRILERRRDVDRRLGKDSK